jgi:hypothetical protein
VWNLQIETTGTSDIDMSKMLPFKSSPDAHLLPKIHPGASLSLSLIDSTMYTYKSDSWSPVKFAPGTIQVKYPQLDALGSKSGRIFMMTPDQFELINATVEVSDFNLGSLSAAKGQGSGLKATVDSATFNLKNGAFDLQLEVHSGIHLDVPLGGTSSQNLLSVKSKAFYLRATSSAFYNIPEEQKDKYSASVQLAAIGTLDIFATAQLKVVLTADVEYSHGSSVADFNIQVGGFGEVVGSPVRALLNVAITVSDVNNIDKKGTKVLWDNVQNGTKVAGGLYFPKGIRLAALPLLNKVPGMKLGGALGAGALLQYCNDPQNLKAMLTKVRTSIKEYAAHLGDAKVGAMAKDLEERMLSAKGMNRPGLWIPKVSLELGNDGLQGALAPLSRYVSTEADIEIELSVNPENWATKLKVDINADIGLKAPSIGSIALKQMHFELSYQPQNKTACDKACAEGAECTMENNACFELRTSVAAQGVVDVPALGVSAQLQALGTFSKTSDGAQSLVLAGRAKVVSLDQAEGTLAASVTILGDKLDKFMIGARLQHVRPSFMLLKELNKVLENFELASAIVYLSNHNATMAGNNKLLAGLSMQGKMALRSQTPGLDTLRTVFKLSSDVQVVCQHCRAEAA